MTFAMCSHERSRERTVNVRVSVPLNVPRTFALCYRVCYTTPVPTRPVPNPTHTQPVPLEAVEKYLNGNNSRSLLRSGRERIRVTR